MNSKNYNEYKNKTLLDILKLPSTTDYNATQNVSIAIIIPHRKKIDYLKKFVSLMGQLKKSSLHTYDIYVIDQNNFDRFNRGLLLNIGFYIAKKNTNYDRYIFHDIGLYPSQDIFNLYFSELGKNIHFYSGVIGFNSTDFEKINGFPLNLFGWYGGENECLFNRCAKNNLKVFKPSADSYISEKYSSPPKIELNNYKKDNIAYDLKNWDKNGIKQLENYFINYKQYDISNFTENYTVNDPNSINDAKLLRRYNPVNKNNINLFKIDYLALHNNKSDTLLSSNFIDKKVEEKLKNKYFQHSTKPIYMSVIEPLIYWDEIKKKIIDTYTKPKKFHLNIPTNKRTDKINEILKNEFSGYDTLSVDDLEKTIKFIFENYNELIYVRIRDNKIVCSYHIYGEATKVDWFKNLKYKSRPIDESIINILEDKRGSYYTVKNPHNMSVNNCLLGLDSYNYFEGNPTSYIKSFIDMINYTIEHFRDIPDCDILLNRKDFAYLRKDDKYGYDHILNEKIDKPLKIYWPIGVQSKKKINREIPIPSADEWESFKNETVYDTKWEDKHPIAIFRGSSTGCGSTPEHNKRMKLAQLAYNINNKNSKLFNVALSKITGRVKVYNGNINIMNYGASKHLIGSFLDGVEQSKNKYIFNVEGNAQAYRYSTEFKKKSIMLSIKSEFYMWFEPLLKHNKHIVEIDLEKDNIETVVNYLIEHDEKAQKIAENGYRFYKKYVNKKMIAHYWLYYMNYLNNLSN